MAVEFKEKRKHQRYPCDTGVLIHLEKGNGGFWGTLSDISYGGCYIYTFSPLPAGQVITLVIKTNGKEINATGKTVSCHPGVGMGIAFNGFASADGETILKSFVAHLAMQPKSQEPSGVFH